MAAAATAAAIAAYLPITHPKGNFVNSCPSSPLTALSSAAFRRRSRRPLRLSIPFQRLRTSVSGGIVGVTVTASVGKLSDAELVPVPEAAGEMESKFPAGSGVYAVYDKSGVLQFIGLSRNLAASIAWHEKAVPDLCGSVKVGLIDGAAPDRTILTDAWKSWMEEHIAVSGTVPPGNETGNTTWVRRPQKKPNLRLTPGRHVQLTVPLELLIDRLVKENKVVAFIKGTRSAPLCGFSQRVVGILESQGVDFECVDVLDEEYNYGLRETLKKYSNWPTFPQVFVGGELLGGCDIISDMQQKGELTKVLQN